MTKRLNNYWTVRLSRVRNGRLHLSHCPPVPDSNTPLQCNFHILMFVCNRQWLKSNNFEDSQRKSRKILPSSVAIPVNYDFLSRVLHLTSTNGFYAFNGFHFELRDIDLPLKSSKRSTNGVALLVKDLSRLNHPKFSWNESLERDLPSSWERHGDLVLLPEHCFLRDEWMDLGK